IICGRSGIREGYHTGRGRITLRARADIREEGNRAQIIISEVPYQQVRNRLAEAIGELIKDERIKGISGMRDESSARSGEPVRLVIDLKRGEDPQLVLNQLYQYSPLQKTVSIILLALVDGQPRTLNLKQMMDEYLRHRVQVIRRRTEFMLREAKRRAHILEGQLIAISSLDEVIQICRNSPSRAEAKERLQNHEVAASLLERALGADHFTALQRELGALASYRMTEAQADAVVRLQLGQLAALERDEIFKEYNTLREQIRSYEELLSSEANIRAVVRKDLEELKQKYSSERKTEIQDMELGPVNYEDLIAEELNAVSISHMGYIKRLPLKTYRSQHRGGKGITGAAARDDDFIEHFFVASTHAYLLCFTNTGRVYWIKVYDIPQMSRTSPGRAIANVLSLKAEEKISSVIPVRRFEEDRYLLMATSRGIVKKTALEQYSRPKAGGIIGISLDEEDALISVQLTQPGDEVVLCTREGMAIRFAESDARAMGRNTRGVKGINLKPSDNVIGMVVADPEGYLLTLCENGYGKRTPFGANTAGEGEEEAETETEEATPEEPAAEGEADAEAGEGEESRSGMRYRKQRRGGKGLRDIRTTARNGPVVGITSLRDGDDIMLITTRGMVNRTRVDEIRVIGRNTQGVRIMDLSDDDKIASIAKVAKEEVDETAARRAERAEGAEEPETPETEPEASAGEEPEATAGDETE
ncbi:MAG: DNA gyrase C-terminal beta-propeller domain-containing protein, partial [Gemmataceae bacterium]